MKAWGEDQAVGDDIVMLGDGNGDFTAARWAWRWTVAASAWASASQRYSMIVKDGVVKELNVRAGRRIRVSAADYMLRSSR
jgi:peroxiredoxin